MYLTFLQTSCYSLIALPTGGRWSEIKTLTRRCVKSITNENGQTEYLLNGRTFKLEADFAAPLNATGRYHLKFTKQLAFRSAYGACSGHLTRSLYSSACVHIEDVSWMT